MSRRFKRLKREARSVVLASGELPYQFIASSRRRSLSISIDEQGDVSIYAPKSSPENEILAFIKEKEQWLLKNIKKQKDHHARLNSKSYDSGHEFLFLGKKHALIVHQKEVKRSRISFDEIKWVVTVPLGLEAQEKESLVRSKLLQWYRAQAEEVMGGRIFHYSRIMKVEPKKIAIRDQKRIWGCCDHNSQTIHLNWQLILSPLKVIDYVVIHELAHLTVPNHSRRFWARVAKFMPDYKETKKWLSQNSVDMHLPKV